MYFWQNAKPMDFTNEIGGFLSDLQTQIKKNMVKADAVASGKTYKSVDFKAEDVSGLLFANDVINKIETGTPPKRLGGEVDFYGILDWVRVRQIGDLTYEKATAGRITHSIRQRGTLTYQMGGRTDIFTDLIDNPKTYDPFIESVADSIFNELNNMFE